MHADLTLRTIENDDELRTLHRMILTVFIGKDDLSRAFEAYDARMRLAPDLPVHGRRGIFIDDTIASACLVYARQIRIGYSYVPVACVGAVFTDPEFRGRGLAGRLITDIIGYAAKRGDGLLLLDGVNGLYDRFGFVSIHNWTQFTFQIDEILNGPTADISIRQATVADAADLQARYFHHFGAYTGSFLRTSALQHHHLRAGNPYSKVFIAYAADGRSRGHMKHHMLQHGSSSEVTADDPETAIALLRHHAAAARSHDPMADALHWLVPPHSELADWLADRYEVVIRTPVQPRGGWMARVGALDVLLDAILPTWQAFWLARNVAWHGRIELCIGEHRHMLAICSGGLSLARASDATNLPRVVLPLGIFTQLCFGYRTLAWARAQPGVQLPRELLPVLDALFPRRPAWIAGSDFF